MRHIILFLLITLSSSAIGQIRINNGSFEDEPSDATTPHGWFECHELTTPDIFPGVWGVYGDPSDGDTYMGLITRPNNTWESIGQRLTQPLEANKCYSFMVDMAYSKTYAGYNNPIRLRIWLGDKRCNQGQLIYESDLIDHTDWKTYLVKFTTEKPYTHIILEAFHDESPVRYKGNILLDHMTAIKRCGRA
ncbi:MAG: hypothetical protein HKN68_03425 [Saprospiraceae bacterium]|nr:hypothetical protein [Saprospiraceae bacterium]